MHPDLYRRENTLDGADIGSYNTLSLRVTILFIALFLHSHGCWMKLIIKEVHVLVLHLCASTLALPQWPHLSELTASCLLASVWLHQTTHAKCVLSVCGGQIRVYD